MRIEIDLNRRAEDGTTVVNTSRLSRPVPTPGTEVTVFEPEDSIRGKAVVAYVNHKTNRLHLNVDWESIVDDVPVMHVRAQDIPVRFSSVHSVWADLQQPWRGHARSLTRNNFSLAAVGHPKTSNESEQRQVTWA